jgi:pimeloyl-ACP methyl ester carboxylesterase
MHESASWSAEASRARLRTLRVAACAAGVVLVLSETGCSTLRDAWGFESQMNQARQAGVITGTIDTEGEPQGNLIVVLGVQDPENPGQWIGVDSFVRVIPGQYRFAAAAGRYQVGAYEDRNRNGLLDPGERTRTVRNGPVLELEPGGHVVDDIRLALDATSPPGLTEPMNVLDLVARTPKQQRRFSLWAWSAAGKLCDDLDDARFDAKAGRRGLWNVMDFIHEERAGIYFMEPYDPGRIPILFVHGISGYPQEFRTLMEGLDREKYQAWFYFYPSGFGLDGISAHLATLLIRLQVEHDFDELGVVAHSMGGLVSRGAILKYQTESERDDVRLFVTISTPWGGDRKASRAGEAPIELPESFRDMSPTSDYLRWLFHTSSEEAGEKGASGDLAAPKRLPSGVEYHMVLGFKMSKSSSVANDGTVTVASQARLDAQREARSVRAFDEGHVGILHTPETLSHINALIEARLD